MNISKFSEDYTDRKADEKHLSAKRSKRCDINSKYESNNLNYKNVIINVIVAVSVR